MGIWVHKSRRGLREAQAGEPRAIELALASELPEDAEAADPWLELTEVADHPDAPVAGRVRIYAKDNGSGTLEVLVLFATGNPEILMQQA